MLKALKKRLKDQRGLTLVELLAVVVILGIISAIAVPSIGGLIDNSKKEAHVANAQQMVSSAKLALTTDATLQEGTHFLTLGYLEDQKFLDPVSDPDGTSYIKGDKDKVSSLTDTNVSFVKIVAGKVESVKLVNSTRGVQTKTKTSVAVTDLKRGAVN